MLRCLVARVGDERYAVPVPGVVESLSLRDAEVHALAGAPVVVRHGVVGAAARPRCRARPRRRPRRSPRAALLVRHARREQLAWAVDRLEGELELVVKDLGAVPRPGPVRRRRDDRRRRLVVCLLDLRELAERAAGATLVGVAAPRRRASRKRRRPAPRRPRVLVVEDSVGVRELERVILEGAGYQVETAVDGLDGAARLRDEPADLVLSDVEMPGMDGFDLTRTIRRTQGWENVPVVIMTSRGEDAARQAGLDAGARAYLLKNEFDQEQLVADGAKAGGR